MRSTNDILRGATEASDSALYHQRDDPTRTCASDRGLAFRWPPRRHRMTAHGRVLRRMLVCRRQPERSTMHDFKYEAPGMVAEAVGLLWKHRGTARSMAGARI